MSSKYTSKVNKGREKLRRSMGRHFRRHPVHDDPFTITAPEVPGEEELREERHYYQRRKLSYEYHTRTGQ